MKMSLSGLFLCGLLICQVSVAFADWKLPAKKAAPEKDTLREEMTAKYPDKKWDKMSGSDLDRLTVQMLKDNGYLPPDIPAAPTPAPATVPAKEKTK
jgi:hypothetical protein